MIFLIHKIRLYALMLIPTLAALVLINGCMTVMKRTVEPLTGIDIPELMFDTGSEPIYRMIVSSDQKYMATIHRNNKNDSNESSLAGIRLWKLDGLHPTREYSFEVTDHGLDAGRFDLEEMRFIARVDDSIVSWPLQSDASRKTQVLSDLVTVSPDVRYSLHKPVQSQASSRIRLMQIHRTDDNSTVGVIRESFYNPEAVYRFSNDGSYLIRYGRDVPLTLWNVSDGAEMLNLDIVINPEILSVEISPDGGWLALTDGRMYDLTLRRWTNQVSCEPSRSLIAFSPDSRYMAVLALSDNGESRLRICDRENISGNDAYESIQTIKKDHATSITFSPDSGSIYIGTDSGQITKRSIRDQRN